MRHLAVAAATVLLLALAGCGDDDDPGTLADADQVAEDLADDFAEDPQGAMEGMADDLEEYQEQAGGGSATLTIGDQTWEFDSVLCGMSPEETGREDTPFTLSSIKDGIQLDATINTEFGHSISLNDIEDFENPRVSFSAGGPLAALMGGDDADAEIIQVDGKDVSAETSFIDDTDEEMTMEGIDGTLSATCP